MNDGVYSLAPIHSVAARAGLTLTGPDEAMINDPAGLLAVLLASLAFIFWLTQNPWTARLFKVIPSLIFCYFVPTTLATLGVIPHESPLYDWVKAFVLPASLLLLILALDLPAIIRLGPKAGVMLLAGTFGVVIGGPIALLICNAILPEAYALPPDIWKGLSALSGSWIGGGANFVAVGEMAGVSNEMLALMVVPDVFVANIWMGILLYMSLHQFAIDRWTGANADAIRDLETRMAAFHERVSRVANMPDLLTILALGFGGSWISYKLGLAIDEWLAQIALDGGAWAARLRETFSSFTWKFVLVTAIGVGLSFTRARNLEGAGASKIGSVMIYLLVACIGASANFRKIADAPELVLVGMIWMMVHVSVLLTVGRLIRAPLFFVAVGSQANIGGAASAPVVAAAFHP